MIKKLLQNPLLHLFVLILLASVVRLYKIDAPLGDWHSWRQSDTASVTREFIKHNYSIFQPHYQDLSNIPSGLNNLAGWRMVEFPLINYLNAKIIAAGGFNLVVFSRLSSIFFSLISLVGLYGIVWHLSHNKLTSFLTGLIWAIMPYNIFYSRVILPEPAMIAMSLLSLWLFIIYLDAKNHLTKNSALVFSVVSFAVALLLKPTAIFFTPVLVILSFYQYGLKTFFRLELYLFLASLLPVWAWREYIKDFPTGIPASKWLYNGNGIRFHPAWWRWLFAERIGKLILGYFGSIFLFLGLVSKTASQTIDKNVRQKISRFDLFVLTFGASFFAYLAIFATGNVQHDYYQTLIIPAICILLARGITWLVNLDKNKIYPWLTLASIAFFAGLSLFFSWYEIKGFFNVNNMNMVEAGKKVDALTPLNAKIIAPYDGDTAFLFQTNRTGWPIGNNIEAKIAGGATHYVTTLYDDEAHSLEKKYKTLEKTDQYLILDLQTKQ